MLILSWLSFAPDSSALGQAVRRQRSRRPAPPTRASSRVRLGLETLETRLALSAVVPLDGFQLNTLAANDDGSTGAVNLGFQVNFFGKQHDQVFVNNNGNITFDDSLSTFTPFNLTSTHSEIIAP